ncbi:MAG: LysM peptidoglycan-binding domain-containing protein [Bernardetiaceae bacterium]|jgi:peptidoglycan endopeptidase LytF|nr:LysM peptidoglycan-binding domain-containing protein [Bernardetiaceae bacterium]
MTHTVRPGDTLFGIARQYNISVAQVRQWNNLASDALALGQVLRIAPPGGTTVPPPATSSPVATNPSVVRPAPVVTGSTPNFNQIIAARNVFRVAMSGNGQFNTYNVAFPMPTGGQGAATFRDNIQSAFAIYKDGIMYPGKSSPKSVPVDAFVSVGLTTGLARALKVVSENEGNFDAINSYDKAIFSYGFIQFAGGAGGGLGQMLMNVKTRDPQVFRQLFGQYGVDVQPASPRPTIIAASPEAGTLLSGDNACAYLKSNKQLTTAFIAAGFHPTVMLAQIQSAVQGYVNPALGLKLTLQVGTQTYANVPITQIIRTEAGVATLIDLTVNQWINRTGQFFAQAISQVAAASRLSSLQQLSMINEQTVLQTIINNATDARVRDRTTKMLNSGLSLAK